MRYRNLNWRWCFNTNNQLRDNVYLYGSAKDTLTAEYLDLLVKHSGINAAKLVAPKKVLSEDDKEVDKEVDINATDIRDILKKR